MGVQSVALYVMSTLGQLPRIDYAIYSELGREKAGTYRYLQFLLEWAAKNDGPPIIITDDKNLYADLLKSTDSTRHRLASIPAFTENDDGSQGMLRRQCTSEYKIEQVDRVIRLLYGAKPLQRLPTTYVWKGITIDELDRMSESSAKWKWHVYPFTGYQINKKGRHERLEWGMKKRRSDLYAWYAEMGLPIPPKSGCVFCPYRSDAEWADMKQNDSDDFRAAVQVDYAIRNSTKKGVKQPCFLHRSMKPLDQVTFNTTDTLWAGDCSGNCHI